MTNTQTERLLRQINNVLDERLIKLAKISPKDYSGIILLRNKSLLDRLNTLQSHVGTVISDSTYFKYTDTTYFGCPHCGSCDKCLWYTACGESCCEIPFYGINYGDIGYLSLSVQYNMSWERISFQKEIFSQEDLLLNTTFVQAHIDWANLPCWGEEYV